MIKFVYKNISWKIYIGYKVEKQLLRSYYNLSEYSLRI